MYTGGDKTSDRRSLTYRTHQQVPDTADLNQICGDFDHSTSSILIFPLLLIYDIFVNCSWVATRWQQYSTHLHTHTHTHTHTVHKRNNTQNKTKILEECGPCPVFAWFYPGICLTTEEKALTRKTNGLSLGTFQKSTVFRKWRSIG